MDEPSDGTPPQTSKSLLRARLNPTSIVLFLLLLAIVGVLLFQFEGPQRDEISYSFFRDQLDKQNIKEVEFVDARQVNGKFVEAPKVTTAKPGAKSGEEVEKRLKPDFTVNLTPLTGEDLEKELRAKNVLIKAKPSGDNLGLLLVVYAAPVVIILAFTWFLLRRARDQFMGGGILGGFSKSPAKRYETTNKPVTFADVAGLEGVKHDLEEVVEFLKNPEKFQRLGGRVPKGFC
jgi:cell division protease FtsH